VDDNVQKAANDESNQPANKRQHDRFVPKHFAY
jgi:hypothetical protein